MALLLLFRRCRLPLLILLIKYLLSSTEGFPVEEEAHDLLQKPINQLAKELGEKTILTEEDDDENMNFTEEDFAPRRRNPASSQWPQWHPARRHLRNWSTTGAWKRYLPYHPLARFRGPLVDHTLDPFLFTEVDDDNAKNSLTAGQILALINNLMNEGRFKGLRFGISRR